MEDPRSLSNNLLYLAGKITKRVHQSVTEIFQEAGYDITVEQFSVLTVLWYEEGINQQSLALMLDRDKTTIARVIRNMENKKLLVRIPDESDQRNKLIHLTESGRVLQDKLVRMAGEVYIRALGGLSDTERNQAVGVLNKVINQLENHN